MPFLSPEQLATERRQPQIGRVGMRDRQQVSRIQIVVFGQRDRHEATEKRAFEIRVVRDQRTARQQRSDRRREFGDARREIDIGGCQSGQVSKRRRDGPARANQTLDRRDRAHARVDQQGAELENFRARIVRQARRFEVDDGQRTGRVDEAGARIDVDPEVVGRTLLDTGRTQDGPTCRSVVLIRRRYRP